MSKIPILGIFEGVKEEALMDIKHTLAYGQHSFQNIQILCDGMAHAVRNCNCPNCFDAARSVVSGG